MPDPDNIARFKAQAAAVIVKLYRAFPAKSSIDTDELSEDGIDWLLDSGLVRGDWHKSLQSAALINAQLTRSGLSLLQDPERNLGGRALGDAAATILESGSEHDKQTVIDLIGRRLLQA